MRTSIYIVTALMLCTSQVTAQKSGARLIAKVKLANVNGQMTRVDSVFLTYGGDRGFDAATGDWLYDMKTHMVFGPSGVVNQDRSIRSYSPTNKLTSVTNKEWINNSWKIQNKFSYSYKSDKLESTTYEEVTQGTIPGVVYKETNVYNTAGLLSEATVKLPNGTSWKNSSRKTFGYNSSNQLEEIMPFGWNNITGQWVAQLPTTYIYSGAELVAAVVRYPSGAGDSTVYLTNGQDQLVQQTQFTSLPGSAQYLPLLRTNFEYDAAGNQVARVIQVPDAATSAFVNSRRIDVDVSTYGLPVAETTTVFNPQSGQFDAMESVELLYIDFFGFPAGVNDPAATAVQVNVRPNPAVNTLTVDLNWQEPQSATLVLIDIVGRVVEQWSVPTVTQHSQIVDISKIASGTYILKVSGSKEQLCKKVEILK